MDYLHQKHHTNDNSHNGFPLPRFNSSRPIIASERPTSGLHYHCHLQSHESLSRPPIENTHHQSPLSAMNLSSRTSDLSEPPHSPTLYQTSLPLSGPATTNEPVYKFASTSRPSSSRDQIRHSLTVIQQPSHARMVGNGEKADRRPVDPPPVLKFEVSDYSQSNRNSMDLTLLRSPYFICYSTLCDADAPHEELYGIPHSGKPYMVGSIVSSMFQLREGRPEVPDGHYFVFSDLGVRVEGRYRLKFSVYEIVDHKVFYCASTMSGPFEVFSAKRFPGMKQSTDISKIFAHQGMRLRVRTKNGGDSLLYTSKRTSLGNNEKSNSQDKVAKKPRKIPQPKNEGNPQSSSNLIPSTMPISFLPAINLSNGPKKTCFTLPSPALMLKGAKPHSSSSYQSTLDQLTHHHGSRSPHYRT